MPTQYFAYFVERLCKIKKISVENEKKEWTSMCCNFIYN